MRWNRGSRCCLTASSVVLYGMFCLVLRFLPGWNRLSDHSKMKWNRNCERLITCLTNREENESIQDKYKKMNELVFVHQHGFNLLSQIL